MFSLCVINLRQSKNHRHAAFDAAWRVMSNKREKSIQITANYSLLMSINTQPEHSPLIGHAQIMC